MNHKIIIDYKDNLWTCELIGYDSLPFPKHKEEITAFASAKSYSELQVEIGSRGWHDLINKNQ